MLRAPAMLLYVVTVLLFGWRGFRSLYPRLKARFQPATRLLIGLGGIVGSLVLFMLSLGLSLKFVASPSPLLLFLLFPIAGVGWLVFGNVILFTFALYCGMNDGFPQVAPPPDGWE